MGGADISTLYAGQCVGGADISPPYAGKCVVGAALSTLCRLMCRWC